MLIKITRYNEYIGDGSYKTKGKPHPDATRYEVKWKSHAHSNYPLTHVYWLLEIETLEEFKELLNLDSDCGWQVELDNLLVPFKHIVSGARDGRCDFEMLDRDCDDF